MKSIKGKIEKVGIPKVIPLVIYTGQAKWTAKNKLEEVQVEFEHFNGIDVITGYNLIDIRNEEEAIKEGTAVARMSVIERKNDTEDIIEMVKRMSKYIKEQEERKEFAKEIKYLLSDKLTKEEIEKIEEILIEKEGEDAMLHAQMVIRRDFENAKKKGIKEGLEEGRKEGIMSVAKKLLEEKVDMDVIEKVTGLTRQQLIK